jgi:predicted patatin/cPLA2 family phospholipase
LKIGLVLEGGGMRGVYTTGVLDAFQDNGITFDYLIGVSAGACHATSFLSGQRGRSFKINLEYSQDKRYVSARNFIKNGSVFGMDFIFHEIPDCLLPFDYDAMAANPTEFVVGVTDVQTGKPFYFRNPPIHEVNNIVAASSAIPVFSPMVTIHGKQYLDGGTTDPIPVRKALEDGCDRVVVVLTRPRGYQKQPESFRRIYRHKFKAYPNMIEALDHRHEQYNETLAFLKKLEQDGTALVLAQTETVPIGRFEKKPEKLTQLYNVGLRDGEAVLSKLKNW